VAAHTPIGVRVGVQGPRRSCWGFTRFTIILQIIKKVGEPTSGLEPLTCSSYEFACVRSSPYWGVRKLRLFMRFSMIRWSRFVHCVLVRISPVAVRQRSPLSAGDEAAAIAEVVRQASVGRARKLLKAFIGDNGRVGLLGEG